MITSFYSQEELKEIGFKKLGDNIQISRKASIYGAEHISIGNHVRIDDFCILSGNIVIGDYVHIAAYAALFGGKAGIELYDFTGLSSKVVVYASSDDYSGEAMTNPTIPDKFRKVQNEKVTLKKHVLIGTGCTILPGVTIEEGTSVGSMSLINRSLNSWGIYFGVPCKWRKERSKNLLTLEKQWKAELNNRE